MKLFSILHVCSNGFIRLLSGSFSLERTYRLILSSKIKKIVSVFHSKGSISHCIRLALTLLFLILVNRSITYKEISILIQTVDPFIFIVASFLGCTIILLQALRWSLILKAYGLGTTYATSLNMLLWGNVLAFVTPGRIGELFRGIDQYPSKKKLLLSATVTDRIFSIAAIIVFSIPALVVLYVGNNNKPPLYFSVIILILVIISVLGIAAVLNCSRIPIFSRQLVSIITALNRSLQKINISKISIISCIIHSILIFQTVLLFTNFGLVNLFDNTIIAILSYTFMLCVPISIANIGIREYAFTLFATLAYSTISGSVSLSAASLGASSSILIINIVFPALAGMIWSILPFRSSNDIDNSKGTKMLKQESSN